MGVKPCNNHSHHQYHNDYLIITCAAFGEYWSRYSQFWGGGDNWVWLGLSVPDQTHWRDRYQKTRMVASPLLHSGGACRPKSQRPGD